MDNMTNYLKNKILDSNLQGVYVALFNEEREVSKASYKRKFSSFANASKGQTSNNDEILFPIANEAWGIISHIALFDTIEGGNMLFKSKVEFAKNIDVSSQYKIPKNYLIVRLR